MNKISCNTIRDILPLYVDEVVSEDTRTMVVEHLGQCAECRKQYENMKTKVVVPVEDDIKPLKRFKTAWKKKNHPCMLDRSYYNRYYIRCHFHL